MTARCLVPGPVQLPQLTGPARKAGRPGAAAGAGARLTVCGQFPFAQHGEMKLPGLGGRISAQLGREQVAQLGVGRQRTAGLARRGVGAHQRAARTLVVGIVGHGRRRRRRGHARIAGGQGGLGEDLPGPLDELGLLGASRLSPVGAGLILQDHPGRQHLPGAARGGERERGLSRGQPPPGFIRPPARIVEVDPDRRRRAEAVAGPAAVDDAGTEGAPQPADERRDVLRRGGRGRGAPDHLGDPRHGDRMRALDCQQLEQHPGLAAAQLGGGDRRGAAGYPETADQPQLRARGRPAAVAGGCDRLKP